jgi:prolipoprotein diacylglyceryltransferase
VITHPLFLGTFTLYGILLSCCAALGLFLSDLLDKSDLPHLTDGGLVMIAVSLFGSRLSYVLVNFSYYQDHWLEIPQFWVGGLSWPGALLGAALSIFLIHWIWKQPSGELADSFLPLLGVLVVGIWLTGWGAGIGYGPRTDAWFGIPTADLFGSIERRWPLPILGALLSGAWITIVILFPLKRQRSPGTRCLLGVIGLLVINSAISAFRVDPAPRLLGLRLESWISILALIASGIGLYFLKKERTHYEPSDS